MDKREIKNIVLFRFNDYYNQDYIRSLCNSHMDEVISDYDKSSNISENIYCSTVLCNKIHYILLNSENDDDVLYMIDKCEKLYKIICDVKKRKNIKFEENFNEAFDYTKDNYSGEESFSLFFNKVVNKKLYEKDDLEEEKNILNRLNNMKKLEKKLRIIS